MSYLFQNDGRGEFVPFMEHLFGMLRVRQPVSISIHIWKLYLAAPQANTLLTYNKDMTVWVAKEPRILHAKDFTLVLDFIFWW